MSKQKTEKKKQQKNTKYKRAMPQNIEIKARINEEIKDHIIATCKTQGLESKLLDQVDIYFNSKAGTRTKIRIENGIAELIIYERSDTNEPKSSKYIREILNMDFVAQVFKDYHIPSCIVNKNRLLFIWEGCIRVHLDQVKGLEGLFLELEAVISTAMPEPIARAKVEELLRLFRVQSDMLMAGSYRDYITKEQTKDHSLPFP